MTVVSAVTLWQENVRAWYSISGRRVVLQIWAINWEGLNSINLKVLRSAVQDSWEQLGLSSLAPALAMASCPSCVSEGSVCDSHQMLLKSDRWAHPSSAPWGSGGNGRQELTFVTCWPLWICVIFCSIQDKILAHQAVWSVTVMAPLGESVDTKSAMMISLLCLEKVKQGPASVKLAPGAYLNLWHFAARRV